MDVLSVIDVGHVLLTKADCVLFTHKGAGSLTFSHTLIE